MLLSLKKNVFCLKAVAFHAALSHANAPGPRRMISGVCPHGRLLYTSNNSHFCTHTLRLDQAEFSFLTHSGISEKGHSLMATTSG